MTRQHPAIRIYLAHERAILGAGALLAVLVVWEGLGRGWWADLLSPLVGPAAEALRVKPIFVSSPSAVAAAAWSLFVASGKIWPHRSSTSTAPASRKRTRFPAAILRR